MGQQASSPKITAQDRAIYQLKQQRDKLKQYQIRLSKIINRQTVLAKEAINKNDLERAKFLLRSKKQQESTITKTYDQLDNLEKLIGTIEFKVIEKDVIYGLQQGNEVLKRLNAEMSVDKLDRIMDDLEDERVKVEEISDILGGGSLTNGEEMEVEEEMIKLEQELKQQTVADKKSHTQAMGNTFMPDAPSSAILPNVPKDKINQQVAQQDDVQEADVARALPA